jgi:two-component system response regulator
MHDKIILLIEDNVSDIELTKRAFEKGRITNKIVIAKDGQEALDYLFGKGSQDRDDLPPLPTLILLDLKLPKVDGLAILRRIREHERTKRLTVVILTSSNEEQDIIQCYDRKANSYIRKPVDFNQFTEAIRQLGLYWLVLNEPPPVR